MATNSEGDPVINDSLSASMHDTREPVAARTGVADATSVAVLPVLPPLRDGELEGAKEVLLRRTREDRLSSEDIARVQAAIDALYSHPYGRQLLTVAEDKGIAFEVVEAFPDDELADGRFDNRRGVIELRRGAVSPGLIAHELIHAVTAPDGVSQQEEVIAFMVGDRIEADLHDAPFRIRPTDSLVAEVAANYDRIRADNDIEHNLAALGLLPEFSSVHLSPVALEPPIEVDPFPGAGALVEANERSRFDAAFAVLSTLVARGPASYGQETAGLDLTPADVARLQRDHYFVE